MHHRIPVSIYTNCNPSFYVQVYLFINPLICLSSNLYLRWVYQKYIWNAENTVLVNCCIREMDTIRTEKAVSITFFTQTPKSCTNNAWKIENTSELLNKRDEQSKGERKLSPYQPGPVAKIYERLRILVYYIRELDRIGVRGSNVSIAQVF